LDVFQLFHLVKFFEDGNGRTLGDLAVNLAKFIDFIPAKGSKPLPLIHDGMVETDHKEELLVLVSKSRVSLFNILKHCVWLRADDLAQILSKTFHWLDDNFSAFLHKGDL